jgi:polyferredoxin
MSAAFWPQRLRLFGDALRDHRRAVLALQWSATGLYLFLQIGPLLAPHGGLAWWRDVFFWGVWEPGVVLAALLLGPLWCGLLCPDGAMTEAASQIGLGKKPAAWMRPAALPLLLFAGVTFFGAIFDAHGAPRGALLLVGGPSLAAIATGLVYGRDKRVWRRHLLPGSRAAGFAVALRAAAFRGGSRGLGRGAASKGWKKPRWPKWSRPMSGGSR